MKLKTGEEITISEFFSRWKDGIQKITAMQMLKTNFFGFLFVVVGILIGLYATAVTKTWWLFIILIGSLILTLLNVLGNLQKFLALKKIEEQMKGG